MNEKVLKTLEYHKILGQLTEYAFSDEAKSLCRSLRPVTDRAVIERLQQETSDALGRILRNGTLSFSGVRPGAPENRRHSEHDRAAAHLLPVRGGPAGQSLFAAGFRSRRRGNTGAGRPETGLSDGTFFTD